METAKTSYKAGDEQIAIVTVAADSHADAIRQVPDELVAGLPWSNVELLRKESISDDTSRQLFTFRVSAPAPSFL